MQAAGPGAGECRGRRGDRHSPQSPPPEQGAGKRLGMRGLRQRNEDRTARPGGGGEGLVMCLLKSVCFLWSVRFGVELFVAW